MGLRDIADDNDEFRNLSLSMLGFPYNFPLTFPGADARDLGDDNDEFKEVARFGIHRGYPYTYPFYYSGEAIPRDLGLDMLGFPYNFPVTFPGADTRDLSNVE